MSTQKISLKGESSHRNDIGSQKLYQLQGECKIQKITFLKLNIVKIIFLTILAVISVIGFFFLVWFKWFRVKLWYSQCATQQASHLFIEASQKNEEIQKILSDHIGKFIYFKNLKYRLKGPMAVPVGLNYEQKINQYANPNYMIKGLTTEQAQILRKQYGKNQHPVQIPNYFAYMFQVLLQPFFLLQYVVCIVYFIEQYVLFAVLNLIFSVITSTINYILLYISYKKIQEMAQKIIDVRVLRNGEFVILKSNQIVPGDLIDMQKQIICDCIILKGEIYVNEASLTGENAPIGKFSNHNFQELNDNSKWLFEGSHLVQKRQPILALVVYTGYTTRRGRIIRKILAKNPKSTQMFTRGLLFLGEVFIIAMILYFATIAFARSRNLSGQMIGMRFIDFLGWSFPPTLPIFFNLAYSFAVVRLKRNDVLCIDPQATVSPGHLKIMCFDKTGTLTENAVQIFQVLKFQDKSNIVNITNQKFKAEHELVWKLFASCHTCKIINNQLMGDQIDLKMFLHSQYQIIDSKVQDVKFEVINKQKNTHLQILRINQYYSKFQSMSVLVRDKLDNKIYAFIKGSPQKIQKNSTFQVLDEDKIIKSMNLGGYRTIGFGYRIISNSQIKNYLQGSRQIFEHNIIPLGLVGFENKLKNDTRQTINRLRIADIQPKMITGDNIFIAIQTGVKAGIISSDQKVLLLQGKYQSKQSEKSRVFKGILLSRNGMNTTQQQILLHENQQYIHNNYSIAVDNDFLCLNPSPALTQNMKLFARISPQNKAMLVKKYKQMIDIEFNSRSFTQKWFGSLKQKVGMCGDGANDLMAIKQADVGIGLSSTDASYSSNFTIKNMLDLDYIIRDSKATISNIVQIIRYYEFITFLKIPATLLLTSDSTNMDQSQFLFFNFTSTIIFPIFQAMSKPSLIVTNARPNGNMLGLVNHLRFWGSEIIATSGLIGAYFYFITTSDFEPNPNPIVYLTWYTTTKSSTCIFLILLWPFVLYSFFFYISHPWKQRIYKNYILLILIILNVASTFILFYTTHLTYKVLSIMPISTGVVSILLGISLGACFLGYIYNQIIKYCLTDSQNIKQQFTQIIVEDHIK